MNSLRAGRHHWVPKRLDCKRCYDKWEMWGSNRQRSIHVALFCQCQSQWSRPRPLPISKQQMKNRKKLGGIEIWTEAHYASLISTCNNHPINIPELKQGSTLSTNIVCIRITWQQRQFRMITSECLSENWWNLTQQEVGVKDDTSAPISLIQTGPKLGQHWPCSITRPYQLKTSCIKLPAKLWSYLASHQHK